MRQGQAVPGLLAQKTFLYLDMLARVKSGALKGVDAYIVEVEVDLAPGLPAFTTVGLPQTAVKEAKDRVRAALKNSGYQFPGNRITIKLI